MPKFSYVARNKEGKISKGEMTVADRRDLVEELRKEGFWPTSINELSEKKKSNKGSFMDKMAKVPLKSKMIFCRHLAVMMSSGLSLSKALVIIAAQEKNKILRDVTEKIAVDVKKGVSFADALDKFPNIFGSVFSSMVRMGELSGNLEDILKILADQLEKDHKLISKVRGAMMYPSVIVVVMIVIGILMMTFVVPKLTKIFEDFDTDLPIQTQIMIDVSGFMSENSLLVIGMMIGSVIGLRFFSKTPSGRKIFHRLFLKLPVIGTVTTKLNSARFSRILSSLLDSGTSLVESLRITSDTLGNYYFKQAILKSSEEVQKGITLSEVLKRYEKLFPYLVIQMIEVGEETGKTPDVLIKLAGFYEEEVDQITKNMSSIIEPILMVVIGAAVGFFALSMITPMYSIMDSM